MNFCSKFLGSNNTIAMRLFRRSSIATRMLAVDSCSQGCFEDYTLPKIESSSTKFRERMMKNKERAWYESNSHIGVVTDEIFDDPECHYFILPKRTPDKPGTPELEEQKSGFINLNEACRALMARLAELEK